MSTNNALSMKIEGKFTKLLGEGRQILNSSGWNGSEYHRFPSSIDYQRWRTEALNLVKRVCGENSEHFAQLKNIAEHNESRTNSYYFKDCFGILEAANNDYSDNFLFDVRSFVRAELFGDFLEQAEYLLSEGYAVAAASITGAVLEDSLRKLCNARGVPFDKAANLNSLNAVLSKAAIYDKLVQKEITAKADLRNLADHGHFDKVRKEDVADMIKWTTRFVAEHIG